MAHFSINSFLFPWCYLFRQSSWCWQIYTLKRVISVRIVVFYDTLKGTDVHCLRINFCEAYFRHRSTWSRKYQSHTTKM